MDAIPNHGEEKEGHLGEGKAEANRGIEEGNNQLIQKTANEPRGWGTVLSTGVKKWSQKNRANMIEESSC